MVAAALESPLEGHEAFLAVADENYLDRPTADAIEEYFSALPEECSLGGEESAFSTGKARDLLGWEPKHDWRTAAQEEISVSLTAD